MPEYLMFRLYGPLASWGDIAVGEYRPTFAHVSKSAAMGMIAAALGLSREDEVAQRDLVQSWSFAVKVDALGQLLRDYHTAQVPPARKGVHHPSRRSELAVPDLNTILSSRDYYMDAIYTVALRVIRGSAPFSPQEVAESLRSPVYALYLGRKSCPPALPLQPQVLSCETLREAFQTVRFRDEIFLGPILRSAGYSMVYWEETENIGYDPLHVVVRRDGPVSCRRRQFAERREFYAGLAKGSEE